MATGRLLNFDTSRGFGFVAPDDGLEDVFLHASVFNGDLAALVPGARVDFQAVKSDRGRKAFVAHRIADGLSPDGLSPAGSAVPLHTTSPVADEDQMCDVLSQAEFGQELTELLLNAVPSLTGQQIFQVRRNVLAFASRKGWVEP